MGEGRVTLPLTWGHIPVHYFYATNTPLVTVITTGVLVEVPGLKPGLAKSKFAVLPLHYTSLVPVARLELARYFCTRS